MAIEAYARILQDTILFTMADRTFALNSMDAVNARSPEIIAAVLRNS